MRRQVCIAVLVLTTLLLTLGTMTPIFSQPLSHLPPHSDLFFHFCAHALLVLALSVLMTATPREVLCAMSIAFAIALELAQMLLVRARSAQLSDVAAAALGSLLLFVVPRDGKMVPPSWTLFVNWMSPDDDDDDEDADSHRVTSWAV